MAELGFKTIDEMVGRTEVLEVNNAIIPWKAKHIDFSKILYKPKVAKTIGTYKTKEQDHNINTIKDHELIKNAYPAIELMQHVKQEFNIQNTERTTGAMLSGVVCKKRGETGLEEGLLHYKFNGVAGQSFAAFLAKGITFELEGMANDYVGKGMSGGKLIMYPGKAATYKPEENVIIGNTTFYGATSGEAYIRGRAGERFCIRNSGLLTVVEGVGDHGCEYMTGGHVVVLGETGRNFAAGMSGGIAYIYDKKKTFAKQCNTRMVTLETIAIEDTDLLFNLLHNHFKFTGSPCAKIIIDSFEKEFKYFVKVMPIEYKRILDLKKIDEQLGLSEVTDGW